MNKLLLSLVWILASICAEYLFDNDDSIHYYFSFVSDPSAVKLHGKLDVMMEDLPDEYVKITTTNNEHYVCLVPNIYLEEKDQVKYEGPKAYDLVSKLSQANVCSRLMDVYWAYEICHGRYVSQYHDEKELGVIARQEFYLGNFHKKDQNLKESFLDEDKPETIAIGEEKYPYLAVMYTQGTACDITGKPRTTQVVYVCHQGVESKIVSVTETSSCSYQLIVMTSHLCSHPDYLLPADKDHQINCWKVGSRNDEEAKPEALQKLDDYHDSTFKREYTIGDEILDDLLKMQDDVYKKLLKEPLKPDVSFKLAGVQRYEPGDSLANNPLVVEHTVNAVLSGNECLVGGNGWWKYEFCYGKHVIQFHEDTSGNRLDVLLGTFDEAVHTAWLSQAPNIRAPRIVNNKIIEVTHLYSKGDLCEEAGGHRSVEVKLRCATSEFSSLAFTMNLSEPKTCQYVLTIDSERFCFPLQYANDNGIIELKQEIKNMELEDLQEMNIDDYVEGKEKKEAKEEQEYRKEEQPEEKHEKSEL